MNTKQKIIAVMLVCGGQACISQVVAPEIVASAGDYFSNTTGSLSWTLGEPITSTENSTDYSLTQGFQQPIKISVTAINNPTKQSILNVYPNPVTGSIYIQRDGYKQLQIQLMDMNGKTVVNKILLPSENQLDLTAYANGLYLLKVFDTDNKLVQTLKIEKVQ